METEFVSSFHFPPGFRFHPSDEELIVHYLLNKINSRPLPASVIAEIELYNYNPWDLPEKALFGEGEWYFFSPRDRKYPNGARPNRMAASGYWKATGTDKAILNSYGSRRIGVKKALVFYIGRPPKGVKTDWIMNEYRLPDTLTQPLRLKRSMRLDDWVLCRVRQKGNMSKNAWEVRESPSKLVGYLPKIEEPPSAHKDTNIDIVTDCLFKDCQILASMLADHDLPPIETISSTAFQSRNNSSNFGSVYEDGSDKENTQVTSSFFESFVNPSKGKPNEGNMCDYLLCSNKMVTEYHKNEYLLPGNMLTTNATNLFNQNQSQGDIFNPNPPKDIMNLQELNKFAFSGTFLQE